MSTVVFPRAGLHTKTAPYVVWIETKVTGRCDTIIRRMVLWGVTITLDSAVTTAAGSSFCFCFAAAAAAGAGAASPAKRARSAYRRFRQHTLHSILKLRGPLIRPSIFITAWDWHRSPTCILFGSAPISGGKFGKRVLAQIRLHSVCSLMVDKVSYFHVCQDLKNGHAARIMRTPVRYERS